MKRVRRIFVILIVIALIPIVTLYGGRAIADAFGCEFIENWVDMCEVWGTDIGEPLHYILKYSVIGRTFAFIAIPVIVVIWIVAEIVARLRG